MKSDNTIIVTEGNIVYLQYPNLTELDFVMHAGSTRLGGVSSLPHFSSMNLGLSTDDDIEAVKQNWSIFCNALSIDLNNTVCANQKHGDNILVVTEKDRGKGIIRAREYDNIDGIITNCINVALCIFSADCIPVLFIDTENKVIGAAHCGWKGTYLNLAEKMIYKMQSVYGTKPENLRVAIGAGIHSCCYEVDCGLYMQFKNKYGEEHCILKNEKYYLDLPMINKSIVENAGVKNVFVSDLCTCCNHTELFSHRGSNGKRGLMVNLIQIKN